MTTQGGQRLTGIAAMPCLVVKVTTGGNALTASNFLPLLRPCIMREVVSLQQHRLVDTLASAGLLMMTPSMQAYCVLEAAAGIMQVHLAVGTPMCSCKCVDPAGSSLEVLPVPLIRLQVQMEMHRPQPLQAALTGAPGNRLQAGVQHAEQITEWETKTR